MFQCHANSDAKATKYTRDRKDIDNNNEVLLPIRSPFSSYVEMKPDTKHGPIWRGHGYVTLFFSSEPPHVCVCVSCLCDG